MTRAIRFGCIALVLLAECAFAQSGNSILSRFGPGEPQLPLTARNRSLGWVSSPLTSAQDISVSNPALWSGLEGLRLQGDLSYETESFENDSKLSYGSASLKGLQFSFPVEESLSTRVVAGFLPYSRVGYKMTATGSENGESYTANYKGTGGITTFRAGVAMRPLSFLSLGAAYEYYFGSIDHRVEVAFNSGSYYPGNQTRSTSHNGMGVIAGAYAEPISGLGLAAAFRSGVKMNATRNSVVEYASGDSIVNGASGKVELPHTLTLGMSYRISPRLLVAAEYSTQDWTNALMFDDVQNVLGTSNRFGAGVEWMTSPESQIRGAASPTVVRLGVAQQVSNVHLGMDMKELFITAGVGLPIIGQNRADIAFEYGWRGGSDDPLGKRSLFRLSISASVGESWFVRHAAE